MRTPFFSVLFVCSGFVFFSCTPSSDRKDGPSASQIAIPTKDQIWSSNQRSFSASEFEALRERFPPLSSESLIQLSQWLSLFENLKSEGKIDPQVSIEEFGNDLRLLLPPEPTGFDLKAFEKRIQKLYFSGNQTTWRGELDRLVQNTHFEWNPSLLKDYGISPR